jgi:hypothetical protein
MKSLKVGIFDGPSKKAQEKTKSGDKEHSSTGNGSGIGAGFLMFAVVALAIAGYFVMGKAS